jgi:Uma2 family endonuclease
MASPVSSAHGTRDGLLIAWLCQYAIRTPGCEGGSNRTWLMLEDAPQPDADLIVRREYGGQSRVEGAYSAGAPELAAEVCLSSASHDLGPKLELYRAAGVQEYIVIVLGESRVLWHRLIDQRYVPVDPDPDGLVRSVAFPGLWLDPSAMLALDGVRTMEALDRGLKSREHEEFIRTLVGRKSP